MGNKTPNTLEAVSNALNVVESMTFHSSKSGYRIQHGEKCIQFKELPRGRRGSTYTTSDAKEQKFLLEQAELDPTHLSAEDFGLRSNGVRMNRGVITSRG